MIEVYILRYTYKDKVTNLLIDKEVKFSNEQRMIDYSKKLKIIDNVTLVGKPIIICN